MTTRAQRDLMRGSLDLMVLSVLAEERRYGYVIQKRLAEVSQGAIDLKAGTLYPLLHRLESEGAIRSRWDRTTGRERKWYELTAAGRKRLARQASAWEQYARTVRHLLDSALGPEGGTAKPTPGA